MTRRRSPVSGSVDPEQLIGQQLAKAAVDFADGVRRDGAPFQAALVDPSLDGDMGFGLELEIALLRIVAVIVLERALDIDRVSVVAFDQVAVVAVHRPHEIGERGQHALRQAAAEAGAERAASSTARSVSAPRWGELSRISSGSIRDGDSSRSLTGFVCALMSVSDVRVSHYISNI